MASTLAAVEPVAAVCPRADLGVVGPSAPCTEVVGAGQTDPEKPAVAPGQTIRTGTLRPLPRGDVGHADCHAHRRRQVGDGVFHRISRGFRASLPFTRASFRRPVGLPLFVEQLDERRVRLRLGDGLRLPDGRQRRGPRHRYSETYIHTDLGCDCSGTADTYTTYDDGYDDGSSYDTSSDTSSDSCDGDTGLEWHGERRLVQWRQLVVKRRERGHVQRQLVQRRQRRYLRRRRLHPPRRAATGPFRRRRKAHLGIALDGDADRLIVVDEKGQVVDGDAIMSICARRMQQQGVLARDTVVATVMSNLGLERALAAMKVSLVRTAVGDRYVVEAMRANGYNFGGEQSGHLVFLDHATTGDGLIAAMQVTAAMVTSEKPLSELAAGAMQRVPQVLVNTTLKARRPLEDMPVTRALVRAVEKTLGAEGRVLVRWSGTEPKLRVMIEGPDEATIARMAQEIAEAAGKEIG